jgi:hypothetical protein
MNCPYSPDEKQRNSCRILTSTHTGYEQEHAVKTDLREIACEKGGIVAMAHKRIQMLVYVKTCSIYVCTLVDKRQAKIQVFP